MDGEYNYIVNNIQLAYYVNSAFEFLHNWSVEDVEPPVSLYIERQEDGSTMQDKHGNGVGGLRSPYIDVPVATYHPNAIADSNQIDQSVGNVNGSMEFFDSDTLERLYDSPKEYLLKFEQSVNEQVEEGWLLKEDAKRMIEWSAVQADNLFLVRSEVSW